MTTEQNSHPDNLDRETLERLMQSGSRFDVDRAIKMLVAKKLSIESQLRMSKTDVVLYRQQLIDAGFHPAHAKMEAEAMSVSDWRQRAVTALKRTDSQIGRLRARLSTLSGTQKALTAEVLKVSTAEEAAQKIRELIASGEMDYFHAAVPFVDGLLMIYRKADPK